MPNQTTKGTLRLPDGARLVVKNRTSQDMIDVGAINSAVNMTLNYTKNQFTTANFGKTQAQIRDMQIAGGFTLINFDTEVINALGGGMFTRYTTAAGSVASIDNQTIAAGWVNEGKIPLELRETGGGDFIPTAVPTITSVTASTSGVLAADDDYYIVADLNSPTGFSIYFDTTGTATVATTESIVIVYASATAAASSTVYAGDTTEILEPYEIIIKHTDDSGVIDYVMVLHSANPESGGFQFNVKGANEDGVEEMPISFLGDLDISKSSGEQLFKMILPN